MDKKLLRVICLSIGILTIILGLFVIKHYQPQNYLPLLSREYYSGSGHKKTPDTMENGISLRTTPEAETQKISTNPRSAIRQQASPTIITTVGSKKVLSKILDPIETASSPTPTPPWMQFDDVNLMEFPSNMAIKPVCETKPIELPEFKVIPWSEDVLTNGDFHVSKKTVVAWEHLGFTGYWIHSGLDWLGRPLAAYPLQDYLEKINIWKFRTPEEFDQHAADCVIGSDVSLAVGEETLEGKVTAVLRIPVTEIDEVSAHVMDLVPYLAKTYPESGFDKLEAPELLLYFCGRRLTTERENPKVWYYAQSRIIVAIDFDSESEPLDYYELDMMVNEASLKN